MVVIAPCLISPYTVYRGAKPEEVELAARVRGVLARGDAGVLAYPCPEFMLLGFPRPPAPREVYERLGMREVAEKVARFISRVVEEERPDSVLVVGVRGSPTCGVHTTSRGDPDSYPYGELEAFPSLPREERFWEAKRISAGFQDSEGPGILMELLGSLSADFLEFDKHSPAEGLARLERALSS